MPCRGFADPRGVRTVTTLDQLRNKQVGFVLVDEATSRSEVGCLRPDRKPCPGYRLLHRFEPQRKRVVQHNRPSKRQIHRILPRIPVEPTRQANGPLALPRKVLARLSHGVKGRRSYGCGPEVLRWSAATSAAPARARARRPPSRA